MSPRPPITTRHRPTYVASNAVMPSTPEGVSNFVQRLLSMLGNYRFHQREVLAIQAAVEQALKNAITHGNKLNSAKQVHVTFTMGPDEFSIRIEDEGEGFTRQSMSDCAGSQDATPRGSAGLLLMRKNMDAVRFNARGNAVTLVCRR